MNQERFSTIGHTGIPFWNPVSPELLDDWILQLPLSSSSCILDVGCGRGELVLRTVGRFGCRAIGVEISGTSVDHASREAILRRVNELVEFRCEAFNAAAFVPGSFDFVACVGSTRAVGNFEQVLRVLSQLLQPGGLLLVGEGYWKTDPPRPYLSFLQAGPESFRTHAGNLALAKELSLKVVRSHEATDAEWSHYEDTYTDNIHRFVESNPEDPEAVDMKQRIERWRDAYLNWGRDTLGFGLYLLSR